MSDDPVTEDKAIKAIKLDDIMNEVIESAKVHSAATRMFMDNFVFYDKTLAEWLDEMAIVIPKQPTPEQLRDLYVEMALKYQRAANFYTVANSIHGGLTNGGEVAKNDLVNALVANYTRTNRKRPAGAILERMAESYLNSTTSTKVAAKIVKDFWRERRDTLAEMRKHLEQVSISMATDMKYHK